MTLPRECEPKIFQKRINGFCLKRERERETERERDMAGVASDR